MPFFLLLMLNFSFLLVSENTFAFSTEVGQKVSEHCLIWPLELKTP